MHVTLEVLIQLFNAKDETLVHGTCIPTLCTCSAIM